MGIGAATARRFAQEGVNMALLARSKDKLKHIAEELHGVPGYGRVVYFSVDVQDSKSLADAIVKELGGPVDVLINNAGLAVCAPACFHDQSIDDISMMVQTNVNGVLFAAHAALNQGGMAAQKRGAIVNVTHLRSRVRQCITWQRRRKKGSPSHELCGTNIKVVVVRPGVVATNFHEQRVGFDNAMYSQFMEGYEPLMSDDVADTISWVLEKPERVMDGQGSRRGAHCTAQPQRL